jgi:hypothetical protein
MGEPITPYRVVRPWPAIVEALKPGSDCVRALMHGFSTNKIAVE